MVFILLHRDSPFDRLVISVENRSSPNEASSPWKQVQLSKHYDSSATHYFDNYSIIKM